MKKQKPIEPLSPFTNSNKAESLALGKVLYRAIEKDDFDKVKSTILKGAALNWTDENVSEATTALKCAARNGKLEGLKLILELIPSNWSLRQLFLDHQDLKGGATGLDLATWYGHENCVDYLLEQGGNLTYNEEMDMTTACYAINSGRHSLIKKLVRIEYEKKIGDPTKNLYWNELHYEILSLPKNNYPKAKFVLEALFDSLDKKTEEQKREMIERGGPQFISALHLASVINPSVLQYFLELKADPEKQCAFGKTSVHFACGGGILEAVLLLSEHNATKIQPVSNPVGSSPKLTPLLRAVRFNRKNLIKFFLLEGHSLTGKELNYASGYCDVEIVSLFLHQISDPSTVNGLTAVATAITFGSDPEILSLLAKNGSDILEGGNFSMFYTSLRTTNFSMIERLLEIAEERNTLQGIDLLTKQGQAFFYSALSSNREDIALLILEKYRKAVKSKNLTIPEEFNIETQEKVFFAKLSSDFVSLAVVTGLLDVVKILSSWGADLNTKVGEYNLLTIATMNGDSEIVAWLIENGAKSQPGVKALSDQLLGEVVEEEGANKKKKSGLTPMLVKGSIMFICTVMGFQVLRHIIRGPIDSTNLL